MSASQMFTERRVPANLMFKFIIGKDRSENSIISYLVCPAKSDIRNSSKIGHIGANYCMWAMKMAELCQM